MPANDLSQQQYHKMTETPIPRLILSLAAPTILSMLITSIYNLADTFFVGQLSTSASGAVGIVSSLMAIIQALAAAWATRIPTRPPNLPPPAFSRPWRWVPCWPWAALPPCPAL